VENVYIVSDLFLLRLSMQTIRNRLRAVYTRVFSSVVPSAMAPPLPTAFFAFLARDHPYDRAVKRVRICVRIAIRFRARFVRKQNRDPILFLSPTTIVCLHISTTTNQKLNCWTPLAANRTPNRKRDSYGKSHV
jgi:hypothetical protein